MYDFLLLSFAFAHGVNGLRQVVRDYIKDEKLMRRISWLLLILWIIIIAIGATAIVGGARIK